jgi:hypothetical protein
MLGMEGFIEAEDIVKLSSSDESDGGCVVGVLLGMSSLVEEGVLFNESGSGWSCF